MPEIHVMTLLDAAPSVTFDAEAGVIARENSSTGFVDYAPSGGYVYTITIGTGAEEADRMGDSATRPATLKDGSRLTH